MSDDLNEFGFEPIEDTIEEVDQGTDDLSEFGFESVEAEVEDPSMLEAALRGAAQGATFGTMDEMLAGIKAGGGAGRLQTESLDPEQSREALSKEKALMQRYQDILGKERGEFKKSEEEFPTTTTVANIAGGIVPSLLSAGPVAAAAIGRGGLKQASKLAAKEGAKFGAAYGAGESEGETLPEILGDTAKTSAVGAAGGALIPAVVKGASKLGKGALDTLADLIPQKDVISSSYRFGELGKELKQDVVDDELNKVSQYVLDKIKKAKGDNSIVDEKKIMDELGVGVNAGGNVNKAIDDIEKMVKGDIFGKRSTDALDSLKTLRGDDLQGQKLTDRLEKQLLKKGVSRSNLEEQAVIKGEKAAMKDALKTGADIESITDVNRGFGDIAEIPTTTSKGNVSGTSTKLSQFGDDGKEIITKQNYADTTPFQPTEIQKIIDPSTGRPVVMSKDIGSGKISSIVGDVEEKVATDLENMSISEVDNMISGINEVTAIAQNEGRTKDPIVKRLMSLAGELREASNKAINNVGGEDLVNKRQKMSDLLQSEDLIGIKDRLAARSDVDEAMKVGKLSDTFGFDKGFLKRQERNMAETMLGDKVLDSTTKKSYDLLKNVNKALGRESFDSINQSSLYRQFAGEIPNLAGRMAGKVTQSKPVAVAKSLINATKGEVETLSRKIIESNNPAYQRFSEPLEKILREEGATKSALMWSMTQQPAFRKMVEDLGEKTEEAIIPSVDSSESVEQVNATLPTDPAIQELREPSGASQDVEDRPAQIFGGIKNRTVPLSTENMTDEEVKLAEKEGYVPNVYEDKLGKETVGIGHLITPQDKASGKIYGNDYTDGLDEEETLDVFRKDIENANQQTAKLLAEKGIDIESLSDTQISSIRNMVYQIGKKGASKFNKTFNNIKEGDFSGAAEEAANSEWNKQTPDRVQDFQEGIQKVKDNLKRVMKLKAAGNQAPLAQLEDALESVEQLDASEEDKQEINDAIVGAETFVDEEHIGSLLGRLAEIN